MLLRGSRWRVHVLATQLTVPLVLSRIACMFIVVISHASTALSNRASSYGLIS